MRGWKIRAGILGAASDRVESSLKLPVFVALSMVATLAISAGRADAQIPIEAEEDPTEISNLYCPTHLQPANSPNAGSYAPHAIGLPTLSALPANSSWAYYTPSWHRDRRPAVTIQLASAGFVANTRGSTDWWWISDNDFSTLDADEPKNNWVRNPNDWELYPDWVAGDTENDTTPDQFDALIHRILYFKHHGFRRIILHLPAGGARRA